MMTGGNDMKVGYLTFVFFIVSRPYERKAVKLLYFIFVF